jgi:hypothetical protein
MRFKPKEVLVNLPVVLIFDHEDGDAQLASAFNTFIHGKVHLKYETLGMLGGRYVSLFYMQRSPESQQLRDEFMQMIENERIEQYNRDKNYPIVPELDDPEQE